MTTPHTAAGPAAAGPYPGHEVVRVGAGAPGDPAGPNSYDVVIGHDLHALAPRLVPGATRALVLHAEPVAYQAHLVAEELSTAGLDVVAAPLPDGEDAKTAEVLAGCWDMLASLGFTRGDVVVPVGGGAVTDLGGFAAATWLRGVRVLQVPTTVAGMVDAAVGGKTGINVPQGKNLVGAFHPPVGVLCDLGALGTLPLAHVRAGLAEVVKCGFIADPVVLDLVEADLRSGAGAVLDPTSPVLAELVRRAVQVKADVVTQDLTESSLREILNYGHTFAHAVEQVERFTWRHGDAVAVGMVFAAELAALAGVAPADLVARHRAVLTGLGLPTGYPGDRWRRLRAAMGRDKKTRGQTLRFVVLDALASPTRLEGPDEALLEAAYARIADAAAGADAAGAPAEATAGAGQEPR